MYLEINKTFNFGNFKALLKPLIMKKQLAILAFVGVLASSALFAQSDSLNDEPASPAPSASTSTSLSQMADEAADENMSFHEVLKDQFIAGDPAFMTPILICLIL